MNYFSEYPSLGNEAAFLSTPGIEPDADKDWNERKGTVKWASASTYAGELPKPHAATKMVFGQR
jgi:hypothetical protein